VRIVTLVEGDVSELHIGLKGTMNQLFLKDLPGLLRRTVAEGDRHCPEPRSRSGSARRAVERPVSGCRGPIRQRP
jgi:hypothetical protein